MNITLGIRRSVEKNLSLDDALPVSMPVYVNSVVYLFGVSTLSALGMLVITGLVMAAFGPGWYHVSPAGRFFNSLHFWSTQVFFGAIILHMLTKYSISAWRSDGRWKTWAVGVLTFGVAVLEAFTGFLIQTSWDSQWIGVQSKDAMNAAGIGAFLNTLDTGQMLTMHVALLPAVIGTLAAIHLYLVRTRDPVEPLPVAGRES